MPCPRKPDRALGLLAVDQPNVQCAMTGCPIGRWGQMGGRWRDRRRAGQLLAGLGERSSVRPSWTRVAAGGGAGPRPVAASADGAPWWARRTMRAHRETRAAEPRGESSDAGNFTVGRSASCGAAVLAADPAAAGSPAAAAVPEAEPGHHERGHVGCDRPGRRRPVGGGSVSGPTAEVRHGRQESRQPGSDPRAGRVGVGAAGWPLMPSGPPPRARRSAAARRR